VCRTTAYPQQQCKKRQRTPERMYSPDYRCFYRAHGIFYRQSLPEKPFIHKPGAKRDGFRTECQLTLPVPVGCLAAMSDNSTPSPSSTQVVGEGYDFQTIRTSLNGNNAPPYFIIHELGVIKGVCLGLMWNPLAESDPCEVWVGKKGDLPKWGAKLAETKGPLPVYVRREEGGKWFFIGLHEVTGTTVESAELWRRIKPPTITGIARVVFMKRCVPAA